jgi:hypothetical protein
MENGDERGSDSNQTGKDASLDSLSNDPDVRKEQLAVMEAAEDLIAAALAAGEMNWEDQEQLRLWLATLPTKEAVAIHQKFSAAVNRNKIDLASP